MEFTMRVNMDNAAFEHRPGLELMSLAKRAVREAMSHDGHKAGTGALRDSNGNHVGEWNIA